MSTAIATVVAVIGEVQLRTPQGEVRTLKPGDVIQEGDSIVTAPNGRVELQLIDGRTLGIEPGQTVAITAELAETTRPQRQDAELGSTTVERVLSGENPGQGSSPSATPQSDGLSTSSDSNDGNSFVRLLRVQERIDPLNFEYATARADTHNPFDGGIGTLDSSDAEAGEANDGYSFVRLPRIQEPTAPLSYEYGTTRPVILNPYNGGGENRIQNQAPEAVADNNTTPEDTPLLVPAGTGLLANDSDPDGGTLSVTSFNIDGLAGDFIAGQTATLTGIGSLLINSDGSYTFTPAPDFNGTVPEVTYEISDGQGGKDTATLSLVVTPVTDIADDTISTNEDTPVTTSVLTNDSFEGTPVVTAVTPATHGSVVINPDNTITYTPDPDYNGPDSYTYTVTSPTGVTETATVIITVNPIVDIADDTISTNEDTPITTSVLTNDSFEGTPVITGITQGTHGSVVNNGDGTLTYTPDPDYNGPDSYTYTVTSPTGVTETATVNVTVNPVVDIADDTISTNEDTPITTSVLANDSFEGTPTVTAVTPGTHGTVVINPDNTITYTPDLDYNGPDSYTYTVTSPTGVTETATVNVTVNPVVDIADDTIITNEDTPITPSVLTNDSFEGTPVITGITQGTHGSVVNNGDGTLTYTPDPDYNGPDSYTYTVTSPTGVTETATVHITVNPVVDIADDTISTNEDTPITTSVLTNDSFEGTPAVTAVTPATHGSVVINPDNTITYTPDPDYNGPDSYTYTVTSPTGVTETATVNITVNPIVDIADDTIVTNEDTPITTSVLANDSFEGTPTVTAVTQGTHGTVTNNGDGTLTYTPDPDYNGPDSYTYTVTSPTGVTETATVNVTVNPVVDIADDTISTNEDTPITTSVLTNDSFEGTPAVTAVTPATHGSVVINPDNTITYTPDPDYNGPDSYTYTVTSPTGVTETATVNVTVNPVVDIADDTVSTNEDTPITTTVLGNDTFDGTPVVTSVTPGTHGTVVINPDNTITYTPDPDYNGPDSYTYTVTSPTGVTETATVNVTVNPIVDIADDTISTNEDTPITTSVLTNDSFEGTPVITGITQGTHGTVVNNGDGTLTYTPDPDYNGPDSYTYTVTSPTGVTETATVHITVNPVVDIADDTISTNEDTPITTSVLGNDTFDGTPVVTSVTPGTHGTVVINPDNTITYTPDPDYNGPDSYTYTVTSPTGVTETATVIITVNPIVDIADDTISTNEDTPITTSVLTNDSFEGTPVITGITQGTHGSVVNNGDGTLTYTPDPDYNGPDSYTYTVTSPTGVTETATVNVTVNPVVDIADDTISTNEDTPITTSVLANDSFEGTPTVTAVTPGTHGTVVINPDNTITYTPDLDYNGPDSYTYTVTSPTGVTETATVNVTVNPVVDIADDTIITNEDTPITPSVLTNDSFEGTPVITGITQGTHGSVVNNGDGTLTYTPDPDYNGPDSYTYTVTSPTGVTETATVHITVNPVVDIADDTISTNEDTPITTSVLTNDSFEGTPAVTAVTPATHGSVVINPDNTITYTPDPDYNGPDSYTYTVTSPTGVTETATVNITVNPIVDIADDTIVTNEDTPITTSVLANDSFEGTPTVTAVTQGTHGTVTNNGDGTLTYTPDPDYNGPDSYTYTVTSPTGVTETATVNVTVNPVVDIADDTISTNEDTPITTSVLTNDSFEGTPAVTAVTPATHGSVVINPDNTITYTPDPDYNGPDSYTYTVTSPTGVTETATVNVTVNPVVDIADDTVSTNEDTPITTTVLGNDTFDGTPVVTSVTPGTHGTVVINPDNTITYTPDPDYNGPDSYTYTVTSPTGVTETATVNVTVNPIVDIADDTISTNEDTPITTSVLTNDSFEGTPVITGITQGTHGTVVNNGDGTLTYTPDPDYNGPDSYTYTVTSPTGVTETATVHITVNPVVDIADDTISTNEDTPITTSVLGNDTFDGTPVVTSVTPGTHGTVVINPDNTITYTPDPDYNGPDSYTYTVTSPTGVTETATVNITVNPIVDIADDTIVTNEDTPVTTSVLTNDSFEGTPVVTAITQGTHGTVVNNNDGTLTYTPDPDYNGPDSYTYTVTSPTGVTETATVNITVNPVVDIADDTISTNEDTPVTTSVLANDSFEGTPTVTAVTQGTHGSVVINPDNTITYTPDPDYNGPDSYTYTVTSPTGVTETATMHITVNPVVDIADDTIITNEDTPITTSVLTNDSFEGTPVITGITQGTHGSVVNNGDGTLTYTPDPDYNGPDSYTYTVTSPTGVTETATVHITVNPVVDIADDTISTNEDTPITTTVLTNDSFEGTPVVTAVTPATHGMVVINPDNTITYTPDPDYNGPDSYTYTVTSPTGVTETATVNVTVNPVVDIADDTISTNEDTPITTTVLTNDSFEGTPVVTSVTPGTHGTVVINPDNTITYTPDPDYNGPDSYTYTVTSPTGVTETATVNVTVNPVVDIADDSIITNEDTPITTTVLGNDTFDGTPVVTSVTQGTHGTVVINLDNTITYTPDPDYNGLDSYTYTVTSPTGVTETATVNVTVNPVVDIADDTIVTNEDTPITTSVLGNDSFEGSPVITSVTPGTHGTVVINPDNTVTYTPDANYHGTDSYTYTVTSPTGVTETATVNVTINPVIDLVAADDSFTTNEDTSIMGGSVAGNDSTTSGGALVFAKTTDPSHGTLTFNADGSFNYTPVADYNGPDSYTYTVTDATAGETLTRTVSITVLPIADIADDSATTNEDTPVTTSVLTNDSFEGTPVVTAITQGTHGTVVNNNDGTLTYTPDPDFNGTDSYTYTVTSPTGVTETATVTVTVNPVADIVADAISTPEDTPITFNPVTGSNGASADNFDGTPVITGVTQGAHGTVVINGDGTLTYTPVADYNGTDSYSYTVTSPAGVTETATVTVTVTAVPDIVTDSISTNEDTPITINPITGSNGASADNFEGTPVISGITQGTHGTVVNNGDGTLTYTPDPDYNGTDSYTYTVTSPAGVTETTTVNVTINPVADIVADSISTLEDTSITFNPITGSNGGSADNFDGTPDITGITQGTHGTVTNNGDGTLTYTPDPDYNGLDSYTYTVTSPAGITETATVSVTVTPVADIADDAEVTGKNTLVNIDVNANDTFESAGHVITAINGSAIAVNGSVNVVNGVVTLKADGTLDFMPGANYTGPASFTYSVTSGGLTETATVNVNVLGVDIKDDSGNDDMLSSIDTLTASVLNGQIPAGGTLTSLVVSNGGSTLSIDPNTVTINPDGTFSTTFDATGLPDGTLTVTLNAQDAGGNSASTTDSILKDTVTPVSIDPLDVTNNVTPAPITGTGEVGASIVVKADGVTLGTVTVGAGGTWSYTPTVPLGNTVNQITADATDLYGNTANATRAVPTLEISDGNGGSPGHATVDEAALAAGSNAAATTESVSGSFTLGVSPDALTSIRVGGTDISAASLAGSSGTPITIATTYGQIVINGFNSGTGVVDYRYDLLTDQTHPAGSGALTDAIAIRVVDNNGDIRHDTLNVGIVDDVPTPSADPAMTLAEGGITITQASAGGANLLANDTEGADGARVYDFTYKNAGGVDTTATVANGGSTTVTAQFGSLTVFSNGNWSFTSNAAINHATDGSSEDASFSYRLIDGDGDISSTSAVQPISVTDTLPSIGTPDSDTVSEANLSGGSNPNAGALTQTGTLAVTKAADSIDSQFAATQTALNVLNLTSGGVGLVYVISVDGHTLTATKGGGGATLFTVSLTNPTANSAGYSFVLSGTLDHGGAASLVLPFAFNVTDADTDVVSSQFNITVLDDSSATQAHTLNEDSAQQTWNTQADATGSNTSITGAASHGTASINAGGKLLYTPDAQYSGSDSLTYQIDENGNVTTTTVNITVNPISDAPTLSRDAASIITPEDTAVALGLNAPSVTDATDQNGVSADDNPERLSLITLTGIPNGVQLLDGSGGDALLFTSTGAAITVLLSDATNLVATPGAATLTLTTAQFEALKVNPVAQSAANFTVTMSVTEFEVDDLNAPISGVAGATSTTTVAVDVQAVTDAVDLRINGGDAAHDASINEDSTLDLKALLSASFNDLDGSERRAIIISNPVGNDTIRINGTSITAGNSLTFAYNATGNTLETSQTGFPALSLQAPANFSGDLNGITVTLSAKDTDGDSTVTTSTLTDTVTLNLHVNPIADDLTAPDVTTPEDTAVKFMQNVAITDTGSGTEAITGISVMNLPTGWVIKNHLGVTMHTGDGATDYALPGADVTLLDYKNYTLTPPAHSSTDISLTLSITSSDSNTVNGAPVVSTVTADHVIDITVTPAAELIAGDSDGNAVDDLTMSGNHIYSTHGQEDTWFSLSSDGYVFETPWSNEDSNEQTFALLTPSLGGSTAAAIGSQFKYNDGSSDHVLTYVGTAVEIPVAFLDSVEFKAASNVAGFFAINVEAKTIDTDPDTGASVNATSGSATLTNLAIDPAADNVTLSVVSLATGNEDTALPLVIRPTSADPSETFNVTISGIPAGTVSLVYDGVAQTIVAGSVTITNFDKTKTLTITPPPNSNDDFVLTVAAVSVDTAAGLPTSTSVASILPISVDVLGVADAPVIATAVAASSESVVDAANGEIALSSLITSAALSDSDGSESLTLKLTGLAAGFDIEGATFLLGAGSSRVWVLNPADVATAKLVVPENFSGTVNFSLIPITTEDDGNSLTGAAIPLSATITPTPEATLNTSTSVNEDTLAQVSFALQAQHGDNDETLDSVWIKAADVDANPNFTLFYGNSTSTILADGLPGVLLDAGWYKLTGAAINNIYIKGADNLSASDNFDIQYEITDPSSDASLAAVTTQSAASYSISINAVTDAVSQSISSITPSNANASVVGNVVSATGTTSLDIIIDITKQNDSNAHNTPDTDGSESLVQLIIDGVPQGVSVVGATYIGNSSGGANTGQWLLSAADVFNVATVQKTLTFNLDGSASQLDNLNQLITFTTITRDGSASTVNAQTSWTLQTAAGFDDSSNPVPTDPAVIDTWNQAPIVAMEDATINANDIIDAQISGSGPFSITLSNLPAGMGVSGMTLTQVNGIDTWTASGSGGNAALQALLSGISLTPPANLNSNTGNLDFNITLTTYASGSERNDATLPISQVLTPVTDAASIAISAPDVSEGSPVSFSVQLSNPADGAFAGLVDGKLYLQVDTSGLSPAGGSLSDSGGPLATTAVTGVAGVPDGNYYVIENVAFGDSLSFTFTPGSHASGSASLTAYLQGQETNAGNVVTSSGSDSFTIAPVNSGLDAGSFVVSATGDEDTRIALALTGSNLVDGDSSERVVGAVLKNVPNGFLVYVGANAGAAVLATNAGDDGLGNNIWSISPSSGQLPAYLAILPPPNWSGTVTGLQLTVLTQETGLSPIETSASFDLTVTGVADGITLAPTLSFGEEGSQIALNLNATMVDTDGSETATVTVEGLGEFAAFFASGTPIAASYDSGNDIYTLSGISNTDVNNLTFIQSARVGTLTVTAFTSDGGDTSATVNNTLSIDIGDSLATTGDDTLLYDGAALNGLAGVDVVQLRLGENLDFDTAPVKPGNIESLDLMPAGQNHTLANLSLQDVLDMTDSGKTLSILGDAGDSVSLQNGVGLDVWSKGASVIESGHTFDVYTNTLDPAVQVKIEQAINDSIV